MTETRQAGRAGAEPAGAAADTRFDMPAVDDPAETEVGIILLALDADRLLAGLGMASAAEDPGRVAIAVDLLRHQRLDVDGMVGAGAGYWRAMRAAVAAAYPEPAFSASVRQSFTRAFRALGTPALGRVGLATRVYLTVCWLRRAEVDSVAGV